MHIGINNCDAKTKRSKLEKYIGRYSLNEYIPLIGKIVSNPLPFTVWTVHWTQEERNRHRKRTTDLL